MHYSQETYYPFLLTVSQPATMQHHSMSSSSKSLNLLLWLDMPPSNCNES